MLDEVNNKQLKITRINFSMLENCRRSQLKPVFQNKQLVDWNGLYSPFPCSYKNSFKNKLLAKIKRHTGLYINVESLNMRDTS